MIGFPGPIKRPAATRRRSVLSCTEVLPSMPSGSNHLSSEHFAAYEREGFLCPLPAIGQDEAARLMARIEDFEAETGLTAGHVIRNKGHLKLLALYELIFDARILDAVESVLGPDILCWGSSLFVKEAGDPGFVAWHQDSYYWDLEPADVCSAWIAFAPSLRENGAMQVIPGSHRGGAHRPRAPAFSVRKRQYAVHP